MTEELYQKSITSSEVQLAFWTRFTYYRAVVFLVIISLIPLFDHIIYYLNGEKSAFDIADLLIIIIPAIPALIVYKVQKGRLKFLIINPGLSHEYIQMAIHKISREDKWAIFDESDNIFVATTSSGGLVTILLTDNEMYINSMSSPNMPYNILSGRENERKVQAVLDYLERAKEAHKRNDQEKI